MENNQMYLSREPSGTAHYMQINENGELVANSDHSIVYKQQPHTSTSNGMNPILYSAHSPQYTAKNGYDPTIVYSQPQTSSGTNGIYYTTPASNSMQNEEHSVPQRFPVSVQQSSHVQYGTQAAHKLTAQPQRRKPAARSTPQPRILSQSSYQQLYAPKNNSSLVFKQQQPTRIPVTASNSVQYPSQSQQSSPYSSHNSSTQQSAQYPVKMIQRLVPASAYQNQTQTQEYCGDPTYSQIPHMQLPLDIKGEPVGYIEDDYNNSQNTLQFAQYDALPPTKKAPSQAQHDLHFSGKMKRERNARNENSKSLRFFSHRVCEKVRLKRKTNYNEVADELVKEYFESSPPVTEEKQQHDVKNIRRRVYDALNVLIALNIVAKEKKEIRWVGIVNPLVEDEEKELEEFVTQKEQEVSVKELRVRQLLSELVGLKSLVATNKHEEQQCGRPPDGTVLHMPFMMFATEKSTYIDCSISYDKSEILCEFKGGDFDIITDQQVLAKLGHTYGVESGEVDAQDLGHVRSLLPPGLRHFLPSLPDQAQDLDFGSFY